MQMSRSHGFGSMRSNSKQNMADKGITRVRKKNVDRKKEYRESHHSLRLVAEVWERWNRLRSSTQTHDKLASSLMDCWEQYGSSSRVEESKQMAEGLSQAPGPDKMFTPVKHAIPSATATAEVQMSSTPFTDTKVAKPMLEDVSDISEGSDVIGRMSEGSAGQRSEASDELLGRYSKRARETDKSFIEISFDFGGKESDPDSTFVLDSDDESSDEDYDISDVDDFELDLSMMANNLTLDDMENIPIHGAFERDTLIDDDDEEEEATEDEDLEPADERDLVTEGKAVVFEGNVRQLAMMKPVTTCTIKGCDQQVVLNTKFTGTAIHLKWMCGKGHIVKKWCSQPKIKNRLVGDFLLSAAILTSGNNYEKVKLLFKFFGMSITARTTFFHIQGKHCVPVITKYFQDMIRKNRESLIGKTVTIAGDGRNDSPGHSAQYCTYTFIEHESKDILAMEIIDKRMTDLKSSIMEREGMKRAMADITAAGIEIGEVVTDASTTIAAMIRNQHPQIFHSFDVWHGAKNFGKRLAGTAAEVKNKALRPWIQDLINHFWYCCRKASGNESVLLASWRGILHHTVNIHEWGLGDGAAGARCYHGTLEDSEETKWLEPGENAHKALTRVILDTKLLHSLRHYVNFRHTGELETFHEAILMYCAKRYAYTYPIYKARNMLAALDYQYHKDRPLLKTKTGEPRLHRTWSKRASTWSAYQEREPKTYSYMTKMLTAMIEDFQTSETPLSAPSKMSPSDPRKLKRTLAPESPPPTKLLFSEKKSRFSEASSSESKDNL